MGYLDEKIPGAPNFKYREFIYSPVAIRKGIVNMPTNTQWENIEKLAVNVLQPIANKFGSIRITSGFRSKALNKAVGGSSSSNHCLGEAADIEPISDKVSLMDIINFVYENLSYRTIIAEFMPEGWVHLDYRENGNIKILKVKDATHDFKEITIDELNSLYK